MNRFLKIVFCFLWMNAIGNLLLAQNNNNVNVLDSNAMETIGITEESVAESDNEVEQGLSKDFEDSKDKQWVFEDRKLADTSWQRLKADEKFVYVKEKQKKEKPVFKKDPVQFTSWNIGKGTGIIFLFVIIALVIVLIIYAFFGKQYFSKKDEAIAQEVIDFEDVEEFTEWQKALQAALANNDYRLATRILYLQTLQLMNDASIIAYRKETINNVYVQKLYNTQYYKPFYELTRLFDYTWYGNYTLSAENFTQVQAQFLSFQNNILT
jgi:hypothetical protein